MSPAADSPGIVPTDRDLVESDLVERAKRDPDAFAELYRRHRLLIYRFALSRLGDQTDADDAVSEVFCRAWAAIGRYEDRGLPFRSWLFQIASHAVVDQLRQRRVPMASLDEHLGLVAPDVSVEDLVIARGQLRQVWIAAASLCATQRAAFALRFCLDLSHDEIARRTGRSRGASKLVLFRAVERVRERRRRWGWAS